MEYRNPNYDSLPDESLAELSLNGEKIATEFLLERYKDRVRSCARLYYLAGGDDDDLIQEGMIGLFKAICTFDKDKNSSFNTFANLCIKRQMITAVKTANRKKHLPLNSYVPLTGYGEEDEEEKILDFLVSNPEEIFIDKENMEIIEEKISDGLSSLEQTVLYLYVKGNSYREISEILKKEPKSIDNALQRLKKKMVDIIENSD